MKKVNIQTVGLVSPGEPSLFSEIQSMSCIYIVTLELQIGPLNIEHFPASFKVTIIIIIIMIIIINVILVVYL